MESLKTESKEKEWHSLNQLYQPTEKTIKEIKKNKIRKTLQKFKRAF